MRLTDNQRNYNTSSKVQPLDLQHDDIYERPLEPSQAFYQGGCPCGAVRIVVEATPLPEAQPINECNCSQCWRLASVHFYPIMMKPAGIVKVQGARKLTAYIGKHREEGYDSGPQFCKDCGMWMVISMKLSEDEKAMQRADQAKEPKEQWVQLNSAVVNLRTIYDVDWSRSSISKYDGRNQKSVRVYKVE